MANSRSAAWKIIPQFQALSIPATVRFYTTELDFKLGGESSISPDTEPFFCSLFKGFKAAANIYFYKCSPEEFHPMTAWIAMEEQSLEEFYGALRAKGAVEVVEQIEDKHWGYRQFKIRDCNGNFLVFFRFLESGDDAEDGSAETADEK